MKNFGRSAVWVILVLLLIAGGVWYWRVNQTPKLEPQQPVGPGTEVTPETPSQTPSEIPGCLPESVICVANPRPEQAIESPLKVTGVARGTWYFEASFPVFLTNWDGLIIAQGVAQAQSDWMTENFVPFEVTLTFESPYKPGDPDFMSRGALILQKDNPSGLPEFDAAVEIPVSFK